MKKTIAVIGNGVMTLDCMKHMVAHDGTDLRIVLTNPDEISPGTEKTIRKFCETHAIQHEHTKDLNSQNVLDILESLELDYIFNIDSFSIIREALLTLPKHGIINFHNSPLPLYRGANAPSWAIINDDKEFGVTWHFMDDGIDTGDILWITTFDVRPNETARTLIFKSVEAGIRLFKDNYDNFIENEPNTTPQPEEGSRYFRRDKPNDGYVDFSWPARKIDCMIRGLDFRPFENTFIRPKAKLGNAEYFINQVKVLEPKEAAIASGKVLSVSKKGIEISAQDDVILIQDMSDMKGDGIDFESLDINQL